MVKNALNQMKYKGRHLDNNPISLERRDEDVLIRLRIGHIYTKHMAILLKKRATKNMLNI